MNSKEEILKNIKILEQENFKIIQKIELELKERNIKADIYETCRKLKNQKENLISLQEKAKEILNNKNEINLEDVSQIITEIENTMKE